MHRRRQRRCTGLWYRKWGRGEKAATSKDGGDAVGVVGHEAIDTELEEAFCVVGAVYGPDDEAEVEGAGEVAEAFVEDLNSVAAFRNVDGAADAGTDPAVEVEEGGGEQTGDFTAIGGGGELRLETADFADGVGVERAEDDAGLETEVVDRPEDGVDEAGSSLLRSR